MNNFEFRKDSVCFSLSITFYSKTFHSESCISRLIPSSSACCVISSGFYERYPFLLSYFVVLSLPQPFPGSSQFGFPMRVTFCGTLHLGCLILWSGWRTIARVALRSCVATSGSELVVMSYREPFAFASEPLRCLLQPFAMPTVHSLQASVVLPVYSAATFNFVIPRTGALRCTLLGTQLQALRAYALCCKLLGSFRGAYGTLLRPFAMPTVYSVATFREASGLLLLQPFAVPYGVLCCNLLRCLRCTRCNLLRCLRYTLLQSFAIPTVCCAVTFRDAFTSSTHVVSFDVATYWHRKKFTREHGAGLHVAADIGTGSLPCGHCNRLTVGQCKSFTTAEGEQVCQLTAQKSLVDFTKGCATIPFCCVSDEPSAVLAGTVCDNLLRCPVTFC